MSLSKVCSIDMRTSTVSLRCVLCLIVIGVASVSSVAAQPRTLYTYEIGPNDLLRINVFEEPNLNVERRVAADGTVQLPLIGQIVAEGLSEAELTRRLKAALEESFLQRASVTVEVIEVHSSPISVTGAVGRPGNLNVTGRLMLLDALAEAGGLSTQRGSVIRVLRTAENGLSDQLEISIDELLSGRRPQLNMPIFANDLITVPAESLSTIYFLGEIANPSAQTFRGGERVTLLMAIARAGGLTDRAAKTILVRRSERNGSTSDIRLNYKRVLKGKEENIELRDQDIIIVGESFF